MHSEMMKWNKRLIVQKKFGSCNSFLDALSKLRPCHKIFPEGGGKSESPTQYVTVVN